MPSWSKTIARRSATHWLVIWLAPVFAVLGAPTQAGTVTYVYTDVQGTPLAKADANGNIVATFDYAPYGAQALGTPPSGPGYTGHVNDPDTGLIYMQARYYDPAVGRFLSVDPTSISVGNIFNFSRYAYADNNPTMRFDPNGRDNILGIMANFPNDLGTPKTSDRTIQSAAQQSVDLTVNAVLKGGTQEMRRNVAKWTVTVDPRIPATTTGGAAQTWSDSVHTLYTAEIGLMADPTGAAWTLGGGVSAQGGDPALFVVGAHELAHTTAQNMAIPAGPINEHDASAQAIGLLKSSPSIKPGTVIQHVLKVKQ